MVSETMFVKILALLVGSFLLPLAMPGFGLAQKGPATPSGQAALQEQSLADQIRALQDKVARLEAALDRYRPGPPSVNAPAGKDMGMMQGMPLAQTGQAAPGMKMGGMDMGGMGMGGMSGGMGMMGMMGRNPTTESMAMGGMSLPSALPGFPGASHIYHIGSTDFFLDHPQHITLTTEQQTAINRTKEQALLAQAEWQRKIDQAEQDLWEFTAADQPDGPRIEAKVREIEKLRGDQRIAFIRSVGEAAKVLTPEQIKSLVGQAPPAGPSGSPAHQHQP